MKPNTKVHVVFLKSSNGCDDKRKSSITIKRDRLDVTLPTSRSVCFLINQFRSCRGSSRIGYFLIGLMTNLFKKSSEPQRDELNEESNSNCQRKRTRPKSMDEARPRCQSVLHPLAMRVHGLDRVDASLAAASTLELPATL